MSGTRRAPTAGAPSRAARSLTDDLRGRDDEQLAALLTARPDLVHPVPADLGALAGRATTPGSVARALDSLDTWTLQVLQAYAALPEPASVAAVCAGLPGGDADGVTAVTARLRTLALVWGPDDAVHLVRTARQAFGEHPGGLGPALASARRGVAAYAEDPDLVLQRMAEAPDEARDALDRMLWGSPVGHLAGADRSVTPESARTPVEWLLAHHLLEPLDPTTVVVPREVALPLRRGVLVRETEPTPPPVRLTGQDPARVDATAGQQAYWFVRHVAALLEAWSLAPPTVLRTRGLGVRDLARAATLLDLDEPSTALVVETAYDAGLLGADGDVPESWCPTAAYDGWRDRPLAQQWAVLAAAWFGSIRVPALLSEQPRPNLLSRDLERPRAPQARRAVLAALAALPPGQAAEPASLLTALAWHHPRRESPLQTLLYLATLAEAEQLGVTGLGALAATGRALLTAGRESDEPGARAVPRTGRLLAPPGLVAAVEPLLPALLDHVLLQADLTAVAPGPLEPDLAAELALLADVESTGGATVYRFSERSVRRALDAGRNGTDLLALLAARSRTPVPQPLEYLIGDAGRRHGVLRVGAASSYLRCDDPTTLAAVLADRRSAALGLTRLADTVLAAQAPPDVVLARLRDAGFAPAAEAPDGTVVVRRPEEHRAPDRPPSRLEVDPPAPPPELLTAAVRALRAGDRAAAHRPAPDAETGRLPSSTTTETLAVLRDALGSDSAVWIGYADATGTTSERVVEPLRLEGGFLTAYDVRSARVRTFTIARITAASAVAS